MMSQKRLEGKTVLVTGGGSGIGLAVARRFAAEGARVVITGRTEEKLRSACQAAGDRVTYRICDGADPEQVLQAVVWAVDHLGGRLDILVNNAGINTKNRSTRALTPETWRQVVQANLDSVYLFTHAALPVMTAQKAGLVINISSTAGKRPSKLSGAAYSASKFGVAAFSHSVALEEAVNGIRATVIYPGEVDTPILEQRPEPVSPERRRLILQPDDVAEAVLFVASLRPGVAIPELIITPASQPYA